jgi:photosystem II stability/assembly factor-like uncharacterized protein
MKNYLPLLNTFIAASLFCQLGFSQVNLEGLSIRSIGPGAMSGRITALACAPNNPNILYAGAASGGLWRSKNAGTTWEPIFDEQITQSIGAIAVNPKNPDLLWVGTGEGNPRNSQNFGKGIFKSLDGGKTWKHMGLDKSRAIHRIIVHRDNPNVVFAAVIGAPYGKNPERGVYKSTDGGINWNQVLFVNDLTGCADLVADPSNPDKLIAAMWEHQRYPWFFKSGGSGSGIYVSYDGGNNWEKRTSKDGLPEGDLGRIGLAIAPSNTNYVYAIVEAKENALYRSTDAGFSWNKMADRGQGDRPFYYSEIYADPKDHLTLYSIHSQISKSVDGGKSFENFVGYWDIHPDHHAFWINPENPNHIIDGNDGGINITYDGGKTWRFAENIPVGQFYHVNVDQETPYNVYGGLQDNGSWVGPSAVWKSGGIRNSDWQEVYFGDGFDVSPRPDSTRFVYAMSQGGNLAYIDRITGRTDAIQPLHPTDTKIRFNWNAAFAQDPFNPKGIYYGSQYMHHSKDCGQNWNVLSPDLSTADTSKLHQDKSGGLTLDATNAENHCTIIAIAPSPVQEGVIWVGTDDGNVQLTVDGGKTWKNLSSNIPGFPKNAWIPQIEVSKHHAGEAFVVVNNYRQGDWEPYLFHTRNFGKDWRKLVNQDEIPSFCLSVLQDSEVPTLLFLGTDNGLFYSMNMGKKWEKWPAKSLPSVPVFDMKIQEAESDLVLGTFGRGIYILDDIRPLRILAEKEGKMLDSTLFVFPPAPAYIAEFRSFNGPRFAADATYDGQNSRPTARFTVWVNPSLKKDAAREKEKGRDKDKKDDHGKSSKKDKALVSIYSEAGDTLRRFQVNLDTGFNRISWNLDTRGVRFPTNAEPDAEQIEPSGGPTVLPGKYRLEVNYQKRKSDTWIEVRADPRTNISITEMAAKRQALVDLLALLEKANKAYEQLKTASKTIKLVEEQFIHVPDSLKSATLKKGVAIKDSIQLINESFFPQKEGKGIQRSSDNLRSKYYETMEFIQSGPGAPNTTAVLSRNRMTQSLDVVVERINKLLGAQWEEYKTEVEAIRFSLFKPFNKL